MLAGSSECQLSLLSGLLVSILKGRKGEHESDWKERVDLRRKVRIIKGILEVKCGHLPEIILIWR